MLVGEPFEAVLHSTDASAGVTVPILLSGATAFHSITADEYVEIHSVTFVTANGGACYANVGLVSSTVYATLIFQGTFGPNGGLALGEIEPPFAAPDLGTKIWLTAPIGVVDLTLRGTIRKGSTGTELVWKGTNG